MPIDPDSIASGTSYMTATRHRRSILEVTDERVRYSYGGGDAGGAGQWRWQTKATIADDAAGEVSSDEAPPICLLALRRRAPRIQNHLAREKY
jgi:hypothetical protein